MPSYKLIYFDVQAAGERIRYLFALAGVSYVDFRYPVDGDRVEFKRDSAGGKLAKNMGKVPILEIDGIQIGQSKTIERYLAKTFGFMGANVMEEAQIDMLCEHNRDLHDAYRKLDSLPESDRQAARERWFTEDLPQSLEKIELTLPSSSGPFLVGSGVSLADVCFLVTLMEWLVQHSPYPNDRSVPWKSSTLYRACGKSPRLAGSVVATAQLPEVATWRAKRSGPTGSRL